MAMGLYLAKDRKDIVIFSLANVDVNTRCARNCNKGNLPYQLVLVVLPINQYP